MQTLN